MHLVSIVLGEAQQFERFFRQYDSDLRQLAGASYGRLTIGDMPGEAWIVAAGIATARGYPLNLEDADDVTHLLTEMSMDQLFGRTEDGSRTTLHDILGSPGEGDPLVQLLNKEDEIDWSPLIESSFSQLSAYVILLIRSTWDAMDVARSLAITLGTLRKRLERALEQSKRQPSIFDGISVVDSDFVPRRG